MEALPRSPELPPELWERIFQAPADLYRTESWYSQLRPDPPRRLRELSHVCQPFRTICQQILFKHIVMKPSTGSWLGRSRPHICGFQNSNRLGEPVGRLEWQEWEEDMRSAVWAERRVASIGGHCFLALQPRSMQINGFTRVRYRYPADPLQRPATSQALDRALFDELRRFRRTLSDKLPAFANLRELQLRYQVIDCDLLSAIDRHPTVSELRFDFCWFPEKH
ncbi:hypothetical protein BKA70DRAFT_1424784 [Coprinopsis sp. MPI-PUGE-AT-0042]|nr:hypothetical protein BKA70DRAFT_1424784 [Coprinopsis sp. MPI-PUGE-AT-0042]